MSSKFTELLDSQRLRPLWQAAGKGAVVSSPVGRAASELLASDRPADLGGPHLAREPAHAVLAALEESLRKSLGGSASLLAHLLHPLRAAVGRVEPSAAVHRDHPLQRAAFGSVFDLIDRVDDTVTSLLWLRRR